MSTILCSANLIIRSDKCDTETAVLILFLLVSNNYTAHYLVYNKCSCMQVAMDISKILILVLMMIKG